MTLMNNILLWLCMSLELTNASLVKPWLKLKLTFSPPISSTNFPQSLSPIEEVCWDEIAIYKSRWLIGERLRDFGRVLMVGLRLEWSGSWYGRWFEIFPYFSQGANLYYSTLKVKTETNHASSGYRTRRGLSNWTCTTDDLAAHDFHSKPWKCYDEMYH